MKKEKKKWETPKLICLYRGRPEEAVLGSCKTGSGVQGPESLKCWKPQEESATCKSTIGT